MRILAVAVLSAAVAAGTGGAVVAYDLATPSAQSAEQATTPIPSANQNPRRATRPRFAPCTPPAKLERGTCVTDKVRTMVLPAPRAQTQAVQPPRATRGTSTAPPDQVVREDDHDSRDDEFDDDFDDRDDDRDDDHDDDHDGDDRDDDDRDDDDRDDDDRDDDRDDDDRDDD